MTGNEEAAAAKLSITAKLDSAYIIMGQKTNLNIEVVKDRKVPGHFPMFADDNQLPYITLNNDTIELSRDFTSDTIDLGSGRNQINYHIPLQAFDSGFYYLPPIRYVAGSDTAESNRLPLKVVPVNAQKTDEIAGMTDVAEPEGKSVFDKIPDAIVNYWWLILLIISIIAALIIYWKKYRKTGLPILKKKVLLPPYQEAMAALKQLKGKQLWQKGMDDEYFTELTDILRKYISRRFGVAAPEMTSTQFLEAAGSNEKLAPYKSHLRELLEIADYVKFANAKSLPDENERAYDVTTKFVEATRPSKEEEDELKQNESAPRELAKRTSGKIKKQAEGRNRQIKKSGSSKSNKTPKGNIKGKKAPGASGKRKEVKK